MFPHLPPYVRVPRHPVLAASAAAGAVTLLAAGAWAIFRRRPTPEELEERRRGHLATAGRIIDGSLTGAEPSEAEPRVILYRYRVAGVTYECSQDISALPPIAGLRLEFPVQVRYDRDNPGDSIVLAESWNGLWSMAAEPVRLTQSSNQ